MKKKKELPKSIGTKSHFFSISPTWSLKQKSRAMAEGNEFKLSAIKV
jgi:hypothetical protein